MRLTKDDILRSRSRVEYFEIAELGGEIPLRSLSDAQWAQVQAAAMGGMKGRGREGRSDVDMEFDIGQVQLNMFKANCLAISYSIADGSHWTASDIEKADWLPGTVEKVAGIVLELTGVDFTAKEVRSFRGRSGRSGDSEPVALRSATSEYPGRIDDVAGGVSEVGVAESDEA